MKYRMEIRKVNENLGKYEVIKIVDFKTSDFEVDDNDEYSDGGVNISRPELFKAQDYAIKIAVDLGFPFENRRSDGYKTASDTSWIMKSRELIDEVKNRKGDLIVNVPSHKITLIKVNA